MMGLMVGHDGEEGGHFLGEKILGAVVRITKGLVIFGSYQNFILLTLISSKLTWYLVCIFRLAATTFCIKTVLIYSYVISILLCSQLLEGGIRPIVTHMAYALPVKGAQETLESAVNAWEDL